RPLRSMSHASETSSSATEGSAEPVKSATAWWQPLVGGLLLAVAGLCLYANSFRVPFVFDSEFLVQNEASLKQFWPWKMSVGVNRPIGFLSFALNYAIAGYAVWGYHAV